MTNITISEEPCVAVFVDVENMEMLGKKMFSHRINGDLITEAVKKIGRLTIKKAYADWGRFANHRSSFIQNGFELIDVLPIQQAKNAGEIKIALDILECSLTNPEIQTIVLVSLRNNLLPVIQKLQQLKKIVVVVGYEKGSTSLLARNCDRFITIEKFLTPISTEPKEIPKDILDLLDRVLKVRKEKTQGNIDMGSIKNIMRQENPSFDEKNFGFPSFLDFITFIEEQKLLPIKKENRKGNWYIIYEGKTPKEEWQDREMTEEEWEIFLSAIEQCIREGEGNPNQGKLWIINAYLHKKRMAGELPLANQVFNNAIKRLIQAGVLLQPSKDTCRLPEDFKERKEEFLDDLFGVEVIEEYYEEEVEEKDSSSQASSTTPSPS